ncbi:hypothetical protein SEA_MARIDALIA_57 [Gordonia phage Maridalia]|uniref:Uncharacterized protein n=2 Tax=Nymphadoravirus TaxID=2169636 RepID=A0A7G8LLI3_9CAUD|nr:hypothetical protein PP483_gp49 [Gordonia phage Bunnybear]YP_010653167.1 hypothetical protein PP490_gp57 [Gordonia phage Maridalia]AZF98796.1 hypothetical protein SEA_MARIDALIA_57 [Gordonia phage Maridalia]QNJ58105.1 hypothetical protein SEA_BUNNYBEAR_49 [Gordonia phage Bunnybear]
MSGAFPAKFPAKCKHPDCGRWFGQGDLVAYTPIERGDRQAVLMHVDCARGLVGLKADDIELRKDETVCPECHLAHKGECL